MSRLSLAPAAFALVLVCFVARVWAGQEPVCLEDCDDNNSCTYNMCDHGDCVNPIHYPPPYGCCMAERDCRKYCTMAGYECASNRCECVSGDRPRVDDGDTDWMSMPLEPHDSQWLEDDTDEEGGANHGGGDTQLPTNPRDTAGEDDWMENVPWLLIGVVGALALMVVMIVLTGMVAVACLIVRRSQGAAPGARRYSSARGLNDEGTSAIVGDEAYYNDEDL
eukprot:TRINITY_DN7328_c0_g2_i2.p1 TRINITY_DN7328_c0_g2~~TRINITY_DN7328_c0_g2_i2.p1  ORF type:complete len:222 (+),score=46.49 TRINITY_DN7328_c0_g2_i2:251-916(+)